MRHFNVEPPGPNVPVLVSRYELHASITKQMVDPSIVGRQGFVFVHFSPNHSGKTTSALVVAKRLWDEGREVLIVNAKTELLPREGFSEHAELWFRRKAGFNAVEDEGKTLVECFRSYFGSSLHPPIIMIDEADFLLKFREGADLILTLAHVANTNALCNVLLCMSDPLKVRHVLNLNGRTKIKLVGSGIIREPILLARWTKSEIEEFLTDYVPLSNKPAWEYMVCMATLAGTPEMASEILLVGGDEVPDATTQQAHLEVATQWAKRWNDAVAIINQPFTVHSW